MSALAALDLGELVPEPPRCRVRSCPDPAFRRGLCSFHAERRRDPLGRRPEIVWARETEAEHEARLLTLDCLDRLLSALEEGIVAGRTAAPDQLTAYRAYGGTVAWGTPWPSCLALHDAVLALQERLMRRSVTAIPPEPPAAR